MRVPRSNSGTNGPPGPSVGVILYVDGGNWYWRKQRSYCCVGFRTEEPSPPLVLQLAVEGDLLQKCEEQQAAARV